MDPLQARRRLAMFRLGLGVMYPVAGLGARLFGLDPGRQKQVVMLARMYAVRDLALGLLLLNASAEEGDAQVDAGLLVDAGDLAAILLAASRKQVPAATVLLGGGGAVAALALGVLGRRENT